MSSKNNIKLKSILFLMALFYTYESISGMKKDLKIQTQNLFLRTQNSEEKNQVITLVQTNVHTKIKTMSFKIIEVNPENFDNFIKTALKIKSKLKIIVQNSLDGEKISSEHIEKIINLLGEKILVICFYNLSLELWINKPVNHFYKNKKFKSNSNVIDLNGKTKSSDDLYPELEIQEPEDSPSDFGGSTPPNPWQKN